MSIISLIECTQKIKNDELKFSELSLEIINRRKSNHNYNCAYKTFNEQEIFDQVGILENQENKLPLSGAVISVKDAFGVNGFPTYAGTTYRLGGKWEQDTGIVRKLRNAGALFSGKTQMVEFALGGLGQNPNWGAPVNPWDGKHKRVCGGSSCGAGVSLWDGTANAALAADIAGSVRVPASMSGTVGFRPTQGSWLFGDSYIGVCPTLDSPGILTLSAVDAAFLYKAIQGISAPKSSESFPGLSGRMIAYVRNHFEMAQPDIADAVFRILREIESQGSSLLEVDFPEFSEAYDFYFDSAIAAIECAAFVSCSFSGRQILDDPLINNRLEAAKSLSACNYLTDLAKRRHLINKARATMEAFDVLITPTLPISPPKFSEIQDSKAYARINKSISQMTNPVNILNLSSLTLPIGKDSKGLPIGLQIVGKSQDDLLVLDTAICIENMIGTSRDVLGWPDRINPP